MKIISYPQIAVVEAETAVDFQNKFNSIIQELAEREPAYRFIESKPFCAIITYTEKKKIIENVMDEYNESGIKYKCKHCPYLEDPQDRRIKYCVCSYEGSTHKDKDACLTFYQHLKDGIIQPVDDYKR